MLKERQGQEQEGKQGGQRHSYESRRTVMKAEEPLTSVMKAEEKTRPRTTEKTRRTKTRRYALDGKITIGQRHSYESRRIPQF
jgi:hypothetical protein